MASFKVYETIPKKVEYFKNKNGDIGKCIKTRKVAMNTYKVLEFENGNTCEYIYNSDYKDIKKFRNYKRF